MTQLRTLTYVVKMDVGDGKEKAKDFRVTLKTMEQDASKASKQVNDLAKTIGERYATNVKLAIDQTKTVSNEIKAATQQVTRSEKAYERLANEYKNLTARTGKSADQQEKMNALHRLGSNATLTQKKAIVELVKAQQAQVKASANTQKSIKAATQQVTRSEKAYERLANEYKNLTARTGKSADQQEKMNALHRLGSNATLTQKKAIVELVKAQQAQVKASANTQKSMRGLRGQAQNLGWQLQDVAVQAQMGTNGLIILGQQGSQLASGFGPTGALVGAAIAVGAAIGGVAIKSWEAKQGVGKLSEVTAELDKVFRQSSGGADLLSEKIIKLAKRSKALARIEISQGIFTAEKQIKSAIKEINEAVEGVDLGNIGDGFIAAQKKTGKSVDAILKDTKRIGDLGGTYFRQLEASVKKVQDEYKITREQAAQLGVAMARALDEKSVLSMKTLENVLSDINSATGGSSKKLTELSSKIINLSNSATIGTDRVNALRMMYNNLQKAIDDSDIDKPMNAKISDIEKAFNAQAKSLINQTETTKQEFNRRKKIIDDFVVFNKGINEKAKTAYANLEEWKTQELGKAYNKREILRRQIEKAQVAQTSRKDATSVETNLFTSNLKILNNQKAQLGEEELAEKKRIDSLIEQESTRHRLKMDELNLSSMQSNVAIFAMGSQQITSLANMMTNGVQQVEDATSEMNAGQKAAFLMSQGIAAAMALVNGISLGGKLAEMFPLAAPAMITLGTGIGVANATAIGTVALAGAFDKGGVIPSGQAGIVSEKYDEFVGGTMVYNNSGSGLNVTGSKETADIMSGRNNQLKVIVENKISGANYDVQQIDENTVKIIAEKVFSENIDQGVSNSIQNNNSKTTKAMKAKFNVRRNV